MKKLKPILACLIIVLLQNNAQLNGAPQAATKNDGIVSSIKNHPWLTAFGGLTLLGSSSHVAYKKNKRFNKFVDRRLDDAYNYIAGNEFLLEHVLLPAATKWEDGLTKTDKAIALVVGLGLGAWGMKKAGFFGLFK